MKPIDVAAIDPTLRFEGKFRLSLVVTPNRQYLSCSPEHPMVTFTTDDKKAMVFALYRVTNVPAPNVYILQATPTDATQLVTPGGYFCLMGSADDVQAMIMVDYRVATQFTCEIGARGDSIRLLVRNADRYMMARVARRPDGSPAPTLWLPPRRSFDDSPWQLDAVQRWNPQTMANADLRYVSNLRELCRGGISFAGAQLEQADFSKANLRGCDFTGAKCGRANFIDADLINADFTSATIPSAYFAGADATSAKFPRVKFTNVNFDPRYAARRTTFASATLEDAVFDACNVGGASFAGAKMARASLLNSVLQSADFNKADLTDAKLGDAKAGGALFNEAVMNGALLPKAQLAGAKFNGAKLTKAGFDGAEFGLPEAIKERADFTGATLYEVDFSKCDLRLPIFPGRPDFHEKADATPATSRRALFRGAKVPLSILGAKSWRMLDLTGATIIGLLPKSLENFNAEYTVFPDDYDLSERDITGANFMRSRMVGVRLDKATSDADDKVPKTIPNFTEADLRGATMSSAFLEVVNFTRAIMHGINLSNAQLSYAKFNGARLDSIDDPEQKPPLSRRSNLSSATLINAVFDATYLGKGSKSLGANLSYVKFYGSSATLANATLDGAVFSNAYLTGVDFTGGNAKAMDGTNFAGACLANCKFNKASLNNAVLDNACLLGADFTDASLNGAALDQASIAFDARQLAVIGVSSNTITLECPPTKISPSATDRQSICPASVSGPCEGDAWRRRGGPVTSWTYAPKVRGEDQA